VVQGTVALRIDVDTRRGLEDGVPVLLDLLGARAARASFFVTMGPDRSGRALRRLWRPSFVAKMWRSRAWRLYGLRTVLRGTLLPSPMVGAGAPAVLRAAAAAGHEVAPHGWDHVGWQDRVARLSPEAVRADLEAAARAFEAAMGVPARASACPGWRTTDAALVIQEEFGYRYATDVRGDGPFRPVVGGGALKTLQIPTTLPTLDEVLGRARDPVAALEQGVRAGLNGFTAHAEVEGGAHAGAFARFLDRLRARGVRTARLDEVAGEVQHQPLPARPVVRGRGDGRSGWVARAGA
jgi:peptidoglycan/xylan/chitin deacetylase (PgdA/CDA1 family)